MAARVLLIGQAARPTGLARVCRAMAEHLAPFFDVHVLGIDCFDEDPSVQPRGSWHLHRNPASYDLFGELELPRLVDAIRPALVMLYNDPWVIYRYFQRLDAARHRCCRVGYCPVDGMIDDADILEAFEPLDALVVFTEFARAAVLDCVAREGRRSWPVYVIPHGLDAAAFRPLPRLRARQALFPARPEFWDGFWVLNANRNQPRKRLDLTMQGFALFAADKPPDVRLYLHCGMQEIGIDVQREARILGIADRLIVTHDAEDHPGSSSATLNDIYNACQVGVNTATGEGWGLVSFEHGATGAAQVVPGHSACLEIWDGAAEILPVVGTQSLAYYAGRTIDPADLARALERLYADAAYCQSRGHAARERVAGPQYQWPSIARQWRDLFDDLLTASARIPPKPLEPPRALRHSRRNVRRDIQRVRLFP